MDKEIQVNEDLINAVVGSVFGGKESRVCSHDFRIFNDSLLKNTQALSFYCRKCLEIRMITRAGREKVYGEAKSQSKRRRGKNEKNT